MAKNNLFLGQNFQPKIKRGGGGATPATLALNPLNGIGYGVFD